MKLTLEVDTELKQRLQEAHNSNKPSRLHARIRKLAEFLVQLPEARWWTDNSIEAYCEHKGVKLTVRPALFFDDAWKLWVDVGSDHIGPIWVPWFSPLRRSLKAWQRKLRTGGSGGLSHAPAPRGELSPVED